jgi:hypothetical protein
MAYNPNISDEELARLGANINFEGTPLNGVPANTGINYPQNQKAKFTKEDIREILREVTDNDSYRKPKKSELDDELNDVIFSDDKEDKMIKKNIDTAVSEKGYLSSFFGSETFKDFAIIFLLYFFMSQNAIKDFWGNIFTAINPDEEGKVGASGIFVYGMVFAILFIVIKRFT